jgi:CMP/dCMP kinase
MTRANVDPARLARVVVAVDGPSGSGKSSVSRQVAAELGLRYLDTGAMYRAVTWWMLHHGVDLDDAAAITARADQPVVALGTDPAEPNLTVDGVDVAVPIRGDDVTAAVSAVSAVPAVRARLAGLQREAIGQGGIVVEGRDIGTVVAPDAEVKVFLTASEQARAVRRAAEHSVNDQNESVDVDATAASLRRRDSLDSTRPTSPLRKAADAIEIDATDRTLEQVVEAVTALVLDRTRADRSKDKVNQ